MRSMTAKVVEVGSRTESPAMERKTTSKKKRRQSGKVTPRSNQSGKVTPRSNNSTNDKVEELVTKATAHAEHIRAVKMAVLEIQLFLLDGVKDKAQLRSSIPVLTQSEYSDVVMERSIAKQCGYPICPKELNPEQARKGRFRISLHEHKVYDLRETRLFCSANCLVASKTFQSSLQVERDDLIEKEKLMTLIRSIREAKSLKLNQNHTNDHQDESIPSHEPLVSEIQERQDAGVSSFDDSGPHDAIEGYIPQNSVRDWSSNKIAQQCGDAPRDGSGWEANLEMIASGSEPALSGQPTSEEALVDKGKPALMLDEAKIETSSVPALKSAMKKGKTESILKRSVSWGDQKKKDLKSERKDQRLSSRLKERSQLHTRTPQTATQATAVLATSALPSPTSGSSVVISCRLASGGGSSVPEVKSNPPVPATDSEKSERLVLAEELAAALTEAAGATAGGEIGSDEAVARVGISILPVGESVTESISAILQKQDCSSDPDKISASSSMPSTKVDIRWPQPEQEEEDGLEVTTARGAWHDAPPKNFKVEVSMFGVIWMALEEWISTATIAHIYGKDPEDQEQFVVANGREFRRQVVSDADGTSAEISKTFSKCISRVFPEVVQALRLNVPISILEQAMARLVRTMTFVEALPAFGSSNWRMVVSLLLDGLSVQRLPSVGVHLANNKSLLCKLLESTGTSEAEYDTFRGLLLPLGRLPTFSTMSGG